jgi:ferredoxin-NADP reductase
MAVQREAILTRTLRLQEHTVLLDFETEGGARLDFRGGQYLIVDPGVTQADGRIAKRAYSIVSSDREPCKFSLAVRRIPGGAGSAHMHALAASDRIRFSGPWGKGAPEGDVAIEDGAQGWIVVSDTGITGALGLVNGAALSRSLTRYRLLWLRSDPDDFLPDAYVREQLPSSLGDFSVATIAPVGDPARLPAAAEALTRWQTTSTPQLAHLAGDGAVLDTLRQLLTSRGMPTTAIQSEYFFNRPARSLG